MLLATLTKQFIDASIAYDQGRAYRGALRGLMANAEDVYRQDEDEFRSHLGASLIGRKCGRELWYSFRWATKRRFEGRLLRLFNRGHMEEPRFIAMLQSMGCRVWQHDQQGKQFRANGHRGHFGGSADGVIMGIPEMPTVAILGEFKTHNDQSFRNVEQAGVLTGKWEHFVQMQIYMGALALPWGLYCAVNKDSDELHIELVQYDPAVDARFNDRASKIIDSYQAPIRISKTPTWYECKFCDHRDVCHGGAAPERNCRTCAHAQPIDGGVWRCARFDVPIPKATQLTGCAEYKKHPDFK
jgi:hypothetical protein